MKAILRWLGLLLCEFGYCKLGEPYEFPPEHPELNEVVLLARCVRCGSLHRLT